jgi:hypothetical protein
MPCVLPREQIDIPQKLFLLYDNTWQYYRERELPVRILMIAPQPFMEERGAPFAIYYHIKALLAMGFTVDLVTYHIGQPVNLPGLTIYRTPTMPFLKQIKVGPSLAKRENKSNKEGQSR